MQFGKKKFFAKFSFFVAAVFSVGFMAQTALASCPYPTDGSEEVRQCADTQGLARGSRCQRVCDLQQELFDLEYISSIEDIDGQFGPGTAAAVLKYQKDNNLKKQDGIAGTETLSALGLPTPKDSNPPDDKKEEKKPAAGKDKKTEDEFCDTASGNYVFENGLCQLKSDFSSNSIAGSKDLPELVARVVTWLLGLTGLIAVAAMVIGGYWYLTASGSEEQSEKGKKALLNSAIGLAVVLMAYALVKIIISTIAS